jgi:hypothetical protein
MLSRSCEAGDSGTQKSRLSLSCKAKGSATSVVVVVGGGGGVGYFER